MTTDDRSKSRLPLDDLTRTLTVASPDTDAALPHIGLVGDTYTVTISGKDTGGRFCVIDMLVAPGGGPAPHRHNFEETFVLLEGEIVATFRGKEQTIHAGQTVNIPANAPHQFRNATASPARMLCICAPAGQEEFFAQIGTAQSSRTAVPPALDAEAQQAFLHKMVALAPRYETEVLA